MRIVFICGSLEPGRDGVGDYTRRLAGELIRQGHHCAMLALNDRHVEESDGVAGDHAQDGIPILRLPATGTWAERIQKARRWIERFEPDWISLQFVPYSYHDKGLPLYLVLNIGKLAGQVPVHLMAHELWVSRVNYNAKVHIIRFLQRYIVKRLFSFRGIGLFTTQIEIYASRIKDLGFCDVHVLPLFGNIPLVAIKGQKAVDRDTFNIIHFGTFSNDLVEFKQQLNYCIKIALNLRKKPVFIQCGGGGPFMEKAMKLVQMRVNPREIIVTGRISSEAVSIWFQNCDIGISRADAELCGKSGSTIAMMEHGLAVVLRGNDPNSAILSERPDLRLLVRFHQCPVNPNPTCSPQCGLSQISAKFVKLLNEHGTNLSER